MGWRVPLVALALAACRAQAGVASFEPAPAASEGGAATEGSAGPRETPPASSGAPDGVEVSTSCAAEPVALEEIHSGRVRSGRALSVPGLVASSQKFLVSEAKSGSCLWGAFAAAPNETGGGSGLLLVSFGPPHADGEACTAGADGLPDDLQPGDTLEVAGTLDAYVPAACDGVAASPQLRIEAGCAARRVARGVAPEPAKLPPSLAARLAAGKDEALLRDWSGALVELDEQPALQDTDDGDAVFPFGVVRLQQTPLEVHSKLYYFDLSEGGPRAAVKAPHFSYPWRFQRIVGLVFLDYCSWVLAPRDRCSDLSPASEDCPRLGG